MMPPGVSQDADTGLYLIVGKGLNRDFPDEAGMLGDRDVCNDFIALPS